MGNARIERLEKSFQQQEYDSKPLNIVLGSLNYTSDTMVICAGDGFSGTIAEGTQFIEDHPENQYYIFGDYTNTPDTINTGVTTSD